MGGPVLVLLGPDEAGCILLASFLPSFLPLYSTSGSVYVTLIITF